MGIDKIIGRMMLVPEIDESLVNRVILDTHRRGNAVILLDKPTGVTSHDIVDDVRKILRTKKVGHAGALDPFASGLLIILVGKFTKYTEAFISLDKSYNADIIIGVATSTQDPEGQVLKEDDISETEIEGISKIEKLQSFADALTPGYDQQVPIYSSVKVEGNKLRELARSSSEINFSCEGNTVEFLLQNGVNITVEIPRKYVSLEEFRINSYERLNSLEIDNYKLDGNYLKVNADISCSKGTYIRKVAEDFASEAGLSGFLAGLVRTRVGKFQLAKATSLEMLLKQSIDLGIHNTDQELPTLRTLELDNWP
ncbi:MAG: tRNA pseudouridine(55) synthase TruB [Candidatus Dojkabacteria bacterium]